MPPDIPSLHDTLSMEAALESVAASAAGNIPGVEFASITVLRVADGTLRTVAATEPEARDIDALQYDLREGPCYDAVTEQTFSVVSDLASTDAYPRFGPLAAERGVRAQAAVLLSHNGERAGLNLYARTPGMFDRSTIQFAELFSSQAATLLGYAQQVENLGLALHSRQDIGTAVGILMERHGVDPDRAFGYLVRVSSHRNIKLRMVAQQVIDGSFRE